MATIKNNISLHSTSCAICKTKDNSVELYPSRFSFEAFNSEVFSARRLPDRLHYRLVRCKSCNLVRSDPVVDADTLAQLYAKSTFDYGSELSGLKKTYGYYLRKLEKLESRKEAILEIGCGNGFFLEEALKQGYKNVYGVEPSSEAVSKSKDYIRKGIVCDLMKPGLFADEQFDVICMFQVFDHISDPSALLNDCRKVLKRGGLVLILNHNIEAYSARILGERSPIIDIEHTYLYTTETMFRLAKNCGFEPIKAGSVWNCYTLQYFIRLVPFPASVKRFISDLISRTGIGRLPLRLPIGNCFIVIKKNDSIMA